MRSAVWCVVTGMGVKLSFSGWCGSPRGHSSRIGLHAGQPPTLLEAYIAGILHRILRKNNTMKLDKIFGKKLTELHIC